jgi:hypothetical protein
MNNNIEELEKEDICDHTLLYPTNDLRWLKKRIVEECIDMKTKEVTSIVHIEPTLQKKFKCVRCDKEVWQDVPIVSEDEAADNEFCESIGL